MYRAMSTAVAEIASRNLASDAAPAAGEYSQSEPVTNTSRRCVAARNRSFITAAASGVIVRSRLRSTPDGCAPDVNHCTANSCAHRLCATDSAAYATGDNPTGNPDTTY